MSKILYQWILWLSKILYQWISWSPSRGNTDTMSRLDIYGSKCCSVAPCVAVWSFLSPSRLKHLSKFICVWLHFIPIYLQSLWGSHSQCLTASPFFLFPAVCYLLHVRVYLRAHRVPAPIARTMSVTPLRKREEERGRERKRERERAHAPIARTMSVIDWRHSVQRKDTRTHRDRHTLSLPYCTIHFHTYCGHLTL